MTTGNRSNSAVLYFVFNLNGKLYVSTMYGSNVTESDIVGRIMVVFDGKPEMVTTEVSNVDDAYEKLNRAGHDAYRLPLAA